MSNRRLIPEGMLSLRAAATILEVSYWDLYRGVEAGLVLAPTTVLPGKKRKLYRPEELEKVREGLARISVTK